MYKYKIHSSGTKTIILQKENKLVSFIDGSIDNVDYQEYLKWVAEGNVAEEYNLEGIE